MALKCVENSLSKTYICLLQIFGLADFQMVRKFTKINCPQTEISSQYKD